MIFLTNKKIFTFLLTIFLLCNFLPARAELLNKESNFKSPISNSTDLAFNGPINAIVKDEITGTVYVGGQFTSVGQNSGSGIPIDLFRNSIK